MGKVQFPLVNIRKDVVNEWHLEHILSEIIHVPSTPDAWGYYTAYLTEIPDTGTNSKIETAAPKIMGLTEYKGDPINPKTKRIVFSQNQFYVNYATGELMFHQARAGQNLSVDYFAKGSLIEADDINELYKRIVALENSKISPEILQFRISNMPSIVEIGQRFPIGESLVVPTTFAWTIRRQDLMEEDSIWINMKNEKIADGIPYTSREWTVDLNGNQKMEVPGSLEFSIHGKTIGGDEVSDSLNVQWVDKFFIGTFTNKIVTLQKVVRLNEELLSSCEPYQTLRAEFPEAQGEYKVIALPQRYAINYVIDKKTGLEFVFDEPFELSITNGHNITIPYYIYVSSCRISPAVEIEASIGRE